MKYNRLSRRHLLQGLGGFTLALPLLPSLMGRAEAQTAALPRFFVSSWVSHGGLHRDNVFPIPSTVGLTTRDLFPATTGFVAHKLQSGRLVEMKRTYAQTAAARSQPMEDFEPGIARVSPLLGSFLSDALLEKMNVLQGVDMLHWGGHTRGYLGNYTNRDGGNDNGLANAAIPTIDYAISQSSKFYSAAERPLVKAPVLSATWTQLSSFKSGSGVANNPFNCRTVGQIYDLLFNGVMTTPGQTDPRVSVVDRVQADYARLSKGAFGPGRRIGQADRVRLDEYMDGVKTIGDRMKSMVTAGCMLPTVTAAQRPLMTREGEADWEWTGVAADLPLRQANQRAALELVNMMIVNAFQCGTTRAVVRQLSALKDQWDPATFNTPSQNEVSRTDAHGMVFHNHELGDRQRHIVRSQRFMFEFGYADLIKRLDAAQVVPGVSMLDQALVYWSSESGPETHSAKSIPAILAGGGGGYFKTGNYVDYTHRNRQITAMYGNKWYAGVPQNRLLANIAQAMGLAPADYELSDAAYATKFPARGGKVPGYGDPYVEGGDNMVPYSPLQVSEMSEKLPVIT